MTQVWLYRLNNGIVEARLFDALPDDLGGWADTPALLNKDETEEEQNDNVVVKKRGRPAKVQNGDS